MMKVLFYSVKDFEQPYILAANTDNYTIRMTELPLSIATCEQAKGFETISVFTGDDVSAPVIEKLKEYGLRFIAVRAAGYDNVDFAKARELGIQVANVPEYSPYSIAEHALALMMALNRKLIIANEQVHQQNFKVTNLIGFDLNGKTAGIIGTGKIGSKLIKILHGFGCRILGYDVSPNETLSRDFGVKYVDLDTLCRESDIISLHTYLTDETRYLINRDNIRLMKRGVMLINTSRGGCVNTRDVLQYLESGHIGYFGTDVYEKERGLFFYDWSGKEINDEVFKKLMAMPNVLITPHQAFATREALTEIASTTFYSIGCWSKNKPSGNELFSLAFETLSYLEMH